MKAGSLVLLALATLAPAAALSAGEWMVPNSAKDLKNPIAATPENAGRAQKVYAASCVECHGPQGAGDGSSQKIEYDLRDVVAPLTDGAVYWKITHGVGKMPSHAGTLTDEERWLTVNHLRALAKAKGQEKQGGAGYKKK